MTRTYLIVTAVFASVVAATLSLPVRADDSQVATGAATTGPATEPSLDPPLRDAPYRRADLPAEQRVADLVPRLTPMEKASLLHGFNGFGIGRIPRIGLRAVGTTDGPQGVRGPAATEFPSGIAMAASWDPKLLEGVGAALGEEAKSVGSAIQLGPGINIMRTPLGGRSFEYMGEDPLLTGKIAAGYVRGLQSRGVSACVKHFTGNEQEAWRTTINVQMSERALREIYARPFEICLAESHPWSIMAAYNKLNGDYACHSHHLLSDLLRTDWKWDGSVISDWGAWHGTVQSINAGCDLEMGGYTEPKRDAKVLKQVESGTIPPEGYESAVRANLLLLFRVGAFDPPKPGSINTPEHQAVAKQLAVESTVLLKNASVLPLDRRTIKSIAVIGPAADFKFSTKELSDSGGSGAVFPPFEVTALEGLRWKAGEGLKVVYAPGFQYGRDRDEMVLKDDGADGIAAAVDAAKSADVAVVCVGTNHVYDRESLGWGTVPGADKPDLNLIGPARELIDAVASVNPKTIVVLTNGSPVRVEDWIDHVPAIIETWYPGMEGGDALADVLFGDADPSGRLPCTFGRQLTDWKCHTMGKDVFPGTGNSGTEKYDDGVWVGYRHFDHDAIEPRFPFGFGLSYTTFALKDGVIHQNADGTFRADVNVTNTGNRDGVQVVQIYMSPPKGDVDRPLRELAGFARIALHAGESQTVSVPFSHDSLRYWDERTNGWAITPGTYTFKIGTSSRNLPLTATADVK